MALFTNSTNMQLPVPNVGQDPGPDYAKNINSCLTLLDSHDHTPGKGVQITPAGMNINTSLAMNDQFLTSLAGSTFEAQTSTPADLTLYVNGNDLYYIDGVGNNVRITQSGGVAGSPGSISNLTSPASAAYVSGSKTFVWQSNTNISANLDAASLLMRNITPNSTYAITLQPPASLTSNYDIILPPTPSGLSSPAFLTIDSSGATAITTSTSGGLTGSMLANATVPKSKLAAVGQQVSTASGTFTTSSSSFVDITNLSVTITTSGRPVVVFIMADPASTSTPGLLQAAGTNAESLITINKGSTVISYNELFGTNLVIPCASVMTLDTSVVGSPGTYTYKAQGRIVTGTALNVFHAVLVAYEL